MINNGIETQISLVNLLKLKFKEQTAKVDSVSARNFDDPALLMEMGILTTVRDTYVFEEEKLKKMQEDFDNKIKPLHQEPGMHEPDQLFRMTIPLDRPNPKFDIEEFSWFIQDQGFTITNIDIQKGYISRVYTFFCDRTNK